MPEEVDYLIVGQGLAGSVLALSLMQAGKKILVIDNNHHHSSSIVAAGMWNPIVFKKLSKTWRCEELIPNLIDFYSHWEKVFQTKLLHPRKILRPLLSIEQQNDWLAKSADTAYESYLTDEPTLDKTGIKLGELASYGLVNRAGFLNVPLFLKKTKQYLQNENAYLEQVFDYSKLEMYGEYTIYKGIKAHKTICCEGFQVSNNPWFKHLPFNPTKGEEIKLQAAGLPKENIANQGIWILPIEGENYRIGATFDWYDLTLEPTEKAKLNLLNDLHALIDVPYKITEHNAGIRPTTYDRKPIVGLHQEHPSLAIFNGLGTKGVMIAPWLARVFVDFLLHDKALPAEINVERCYKKLKSANK